MKKSEIIALVIEKLREEFESRRRNSKLTRAEGNDAESKAESKYDTLSIEENYLADGLAKQAAAAADAIEAIGKIPLRDFSRDEPVDLGALVELQFSREREWFFLAPSGGGTEVLLGADRITVITPESPLGSQLSGARAGDRTSAPDARILRVA